MIVLDEHDISKYNINKCDLSDVNWVWHMWLRGRIVILPT
jgi:hypothetical protein